MDPLQMLLDEREIRQVLYRRARATDARDLESALSCYHEDATEDHEGFDGPIREYLATASPVFVGNSPIEVNYHLIGNTDIRLDGDDATCESYFIAVLTAHENGTSRDYVNAGRYLDRFTRRNGEWRIQHRQCVYDWSHGADVTDRWWTRAALQAAGGGAPGRPRG
ncbi:nuclear transport factor 2 family protein [Nocardioides caldifontis]|uniref:nuclear transport factor 2 family protein n=1 Tax=Nocardioides caldifontis TaxID=2588938 RepID=UPI0011DF37A6|nr:nuclear transport factor 2 family protein [Nocardioides caldifontis]